MNDVSFFFWGPICSQEIRRRNDWDEIKMKVIMGLSNYELPTGVSKRKKKEEI